MNARLELFWLAKSSGHISIVQNPFPLSKINNFHPLVKRILTLCKDTGLPHPAWSLGTETRSIILSMLALRRILTSVVLYCRLILYFISIFHFQNFNKQRVEIDLEVEEKKLLSFLLQTVHLGMKWSTYIEWYNETWRWTKR